MSARAPSPSPPELVTHHMQYHAPVRSTPGQLGLVLALALVGCETSSANGERKVETANVPTSAPEPSAGPTKAAPVIPTATAVADDHASWNALLAYAPACGGQPTPTPGFYCFEPARRRTIDDGTRSVTEGEVLGGASPSELEAVARRFGGKAPSDLTALLHKYDGGTLIGAESSLQLFGSEAILDPAQFDATEWVPEGVTVGTDNGGSTYVYGTDGVYLVAMGAPDLRRKLAPSLIEVARRVVRGDPLRAP